MTTKNEAYLILKKFVLKYVTKLFKIPAFDLPSLENDYTEEELQVYVELAEFQEIIK